ASLWPRHREGEPAKKLPVPADPTVLASREREIATRVVVVDVDVGRERGTHVATFDEIMRQQRVLGKTTVGRRLERGNIVDPLAGEAALAEEILIDVGDGRR